MKEVSTVLILIGLISEAFAGWNLWTILTAQTPALGNCIGLFVCAVTGLVIMDSAFTRTLLDRLYDKLQSKREDRDR